MKNIILLLLLALAVVSLHCGGSGSISGKNTSLVTITVGSAGETASIQIEPETFFTRIVSFLKNLEQPSAIASIPSNVHKIAFTIAGPDMSTMTKEIFVAGQTQIRESFSVPNGKNRYFYVAAKSISEQVLYQGDARADLKGKPVFLGITMKALDATPPTVISTEPSSNKTGVPITSAIVITFSETIDPATFNLSTFSLQGNGLAIGGTISILGAVATVMPSVDLAYSTTYTASITTGVTDMAGNHMTAVYSWTFTTAPAPDSTPPTVTGVSPGIDARDVPVTSVITATFSEVMNPVSINESTLFIVKNGDNNPISGTVTYSGMTATFTPAANLAHDTAYTATVTTGVKDLAGNFMAADYSWSFTTASPTLPTVISTNPLQGAAGVPISTTISATFSKEMDPSTINTLTFTVNRGPIPVSGTVTYTNKTATFTPSSPLALSSSYTALIVAGVKDISGNSMQSDYSWSFTTIGPPLSVTPSSVTIFGYTNPDPYSTDNRQFTISGGTSPYTVTSSNTALIPNPVVAGSVFSIDANATCTNTAVNLIVRDSAGATVIATVNVQRPSAAFIAIPVTICENDNTCSAGTETSTLSLYGVTPFIITSGNPSVIPNSGTISGYTYLVDAIDNSTGGTNTNILLNVADNCGYTYNAGLTVQNQDIFVNVGTGNDTTGNGTITNPFKTITKALSVTPGNEAIHVAAGTHNISAGETFPLTLKTGTTLDCTAGPTGTVISHLGTDIETVIGASNASLDNCEILADCSGCTVVDVGDFTGMTIDNCVMNGNSSLGVGIRVAGSANTIQDSEIFGFENAGTEVGILIPSNIVSPPTITNTLVHDNDIGIKIYNPANLDMTNSSLYCNNTADFYVDSTVTPSSYTIDISNNAWDDGPPDLDTAPPCSSGTDICFDSAYITIISDPYNSPVPGGCPAP